MRKFKSFENRACVEWEVDYSHVLERKKGKCKENFTYKFKHEITIRINGI